jgi:hypothetical protein
MYIILCIFSISIFGKVQDYPGISYVLDSENSYINFKLVRNFPVSFKINGELTPKEKLTTLLSTAQNNSVRNYVSIEQDLDKLYLKHPNSPDKDLLLETNYPCEFNFEFKLMRESAVSSISCGEQNSSTTYTLKELPNITEIHLSEFSSGSFDVILIPLSYEQSLSGNSLLLRVFLIFSPLIIFISTLLKSTKLNLNFRNNSKVNGFFWINIFQIGLILSLALTMPPQDDDGVFQIFKNTGGLPFAYISQFLGSPSPLGDSHFRFLALVLGGFSEFYQFRLFYAVFWILSLILIYKVLLSQTLIRSRWAYFVGSTFYVYLIMVFGLGLRAEILLLPIYLIVFYLILTDNFNKHKYEILILSAISASFHPLGIAVVVLVLLKYLVDLYQKFQLFSLIQLIADMTVLLIYTILLIIGTRNFQNVLSDTYIFSSYVSSAHSLTPFDELQRYASVLNHNSFRILGVFLILSCLAFLPYIVSIEQTREKFFYLGLIIPFAALLLSPSKWIWHFSFIAFFVFVCVNILLNSIKLNFRIVFSFLLFVIVCGTQLINMPEKNYFSYFNLQEIVFKDDNGMLNTLESYMALGYGEYFKITFFLLFIILAFLSFRRRAIKGAYISFSMSMFVPILLILNLFFFILTGFSSGKTTIAKDTYSSMISKSNCGVVGRTNIIDFDELTFKTTSDFISVADEYGAITDIVTFKDGGLPIHRFNLSSPGSTELQFKNFVMSNDLVVYLRSSKVSILPITFPYSLNFNFDNSEWSPIFLGESSQVTLAINPGENSGENFVDVLYGSIDKSKTVPAYPLLLKSTVLVDSHFGIFSPCLRGAQFSKGQFTENYNFSVGWLGFTDHGAAPAKDLGVRLKETNNVFLLGCPSAEDWLSNWCVYKLVPRS